ncbi:hypothetical protein Tco_0114040, partial [Tanacetum coccineum]
MRPFGCPVTILNTVDHLVFNSRTRIVEENLHVQFSENTPNIARSGPNWLFDIDALTKSIKYKPVVAGNHLKDSPDVGFKPSGEEELKDTEDPGNEYSEDNADNKNIVYGCDDDPNMPELEEIVYSDDYENVG